MSRFNDHEVSGSRNPMAKLSDLEVECIRESKGQFPPKRLAKVFNVHVSCIHRIQSRGQMASTNG